MSDRDSFIDEVSEEVRRDRMYGLWRRYGPYVIGVLALAVIAAGAKTWWDARQAAEARRVGAAIISAAEVAPTEAAKSLSTLADQTNVEGAAVLARLRAAGIYAVEGDSEAAAAAYDAVAADADADPILQDFAAFRAVMTRAPDMAPEALSDALAPLADGAGPFRLLALEAQGLAKLRAGDRTGAIDILRTVGSDEAAPQGLRQRVEAVLTALGADNEG